MVGGYIITDVENGTWMVGGYIITDVENGTWMVGGYINSGPLRWF